MAILADLPFFFFSDVGLFAGGARVKNANQLLHDITAALSYCCMRHASSCSTR